MAAYCEKVGELERAACRLDVEDRFSARAMATGYLAAYEKAIGRVDGQTFRATTFTRGLSQPNAEPARLP